ncbi:hypothetical protein [Nitriliruptor alkaliphilus]|uniref:hypothetical protein n=1 Tax=Nitriliruptor alkaliphilus TaxID=427918 RepID=UPI000698B378|nr:hypothetical protein [Nitriliruptor alkaliphilus]
MATTTTTKKATAKKATTKAATPAAKRSPAAKKAATTRNRNEAAQKAAATRKRNAAAAEKAKVAPKRSPLTEREPRILAEDASYAAAGLAVDAVILVRAATTKLEELRAEVQKVAADPATTVKNVTEQGPATVTRTAQDLRGRLVAELESAIASFESTFDAKATEGRKLVESLKKDARVAKLLDQTSATRAQVKAALTSVTKTVDVAVEAGRKQAETASSQVKGATTSVAKTLDVAVEAGRKQAETARTQVKAATTSIRRSADTVPGAAKAVETEVEQAS